MSAIKLLPDDDDDGLGDPHAPENLHPQQLARGQAYDAREFMDRVRQGGGLRFPWTDLDRMVGPILPGWLVAIGGRAKAGKTTMLMQLLTAWTELGKTVVYVGTETSVAVLRYCWGASRCNVPLDQAVDPARCPVDVYERIMRDVEQTQVEWKLATRAIFADTPEATVAQLERWAEYGIQHNATALIFDHFHRLEFGSQRESWQDQGEAIRQIKKLAVDADMTMVIGAQLKQGEGGSVLSEHEVPGNGAWAGSSNIQREIDVGIQLWRPFKPGITTADKHAAREDVAKVAELVQPNVMAVRLSAHRWGKPPNTFCKLYVDGGNLMGWSPR